MRLKAATQTPVPGLLLVSDNGPKRSLCSLLLPKWKPQKVSSRNVQPMPSTGCPQGETSPIGTAGWGAGWGLPPLPSQTQGALCWWPAQSRAKVNLLIPAVRRAPRPTYHPLCGHTKRNCGRTQVALFIEHFHLLCKPQDGQRRFICISNPSSCKLAQPWPLHQPLHQTLASSTPLGSGKQPGRFEPAQGTAASPLFVLAESLKTSLMVFAHAFFGLYTLLECVTSCIRVALAAVPQQSNSAAARGAEVSSTAAGFGAELCPRRALWPRASPPTRGAAPSQRGSRRARSIHQPLPGAEFSLLLL